MRVPPVVPAKVRVPALHALPRERLEASLSRVADYRLGLVVAPAGSGKTTLLARLAEIVPTPVAWYRAESWDGELPRLLAHLASAIHAAIGHLGGNHESIEAIVRELEAWPGERLVLVVDDLHLLEGTAAERGLERLIDYAPPSLTTIAGARTAPSFNLSRLRVSGGLLEFGADDLRFRPWEVERLFRDFYRAYVPPQELAVLASRTEGWAAGLQLFHLATRDKPSDERRRILAGVTAGSRLTRDYLTRNVLADLDDEVREFLVETSVLGRLSGPLCDQLLGRTGSRGTLELLERRQIFTAALDDEGTYRYHEVLRAHLLALLLDERGERAAREMHLRAGSLLEAAGAVPEALAAYSHAEDWEAIERLLGRTGERLLAAPVAWMDALPPALIRNDPWLILASARRARDEGRWSVALEAFDRAQRAFGSAEQAAACRRERTALGVWLDPAPYRGTDWSAVLRAATIREPNGARRSAAVLEGPAARLVEGIAALIAGDAGAALGVLRSVAEDESTPPAEAVAARLAAGVAMLVLGDESALGVLDGAVETSERLGRRWLARLGRAVRVLAAGNDGDEIALARAACGADGDAWGDALISLGEAWLDPDWSAAAAAGERAAAGLRGLGAGAIEAWARSFVALSLATGDEAQARTEGAHAELFARSVGMAGPRSLAYAALARSDAGHATEYAQLAESVAARAGVPLALLAHRADGPSTAAPGGAEGASPGSSPAAEWPAGVAAVNEHDQATRNATMRPTPAQSADPTTGAVPTRHANAHSVGPRTGGSAARDGTFVSRPRDDGTEGFAIRGFGGFSLSVGGRPLDLSILKPRVRALLRFLVLNTGRPVHREVIVEALWPDGDRASGARSLHVALSSVRRLLDAPDGWATLVRDGDAYRLDIRDGVRFDVADFERGAVEGRRARAEGRDDDAREAFERALHAYRGELMPEDGPADWVVDQRDRCRSLVVEVSRSLSELCLRQGDPRAAADAAAAGIAADRYHDPLWRLLIEAHDDAGDQGAASRARIEYGAVLAQLGLAPELRGDVGRP